ncbi:hypothetical protein [Borrelia persica]|uniref:hypothetical protein n=1 Tax=Borrelia persica TaxID=44448 RepID=UPI000463D1E0|nr:hypothetical protein [Borrelia persica]
MKNFNIVLVCVLCLLLILFIMFGWNSEIKYHSELQRDLESSEVRTVPKKVKNLSQKNEVLQEENSILQNEIDEILHNDNSLSEVSHLNKTREEAYDELANKVKKLKNKFLDESLLFAEGKHKFSMPFFERFAKFDGDDKKDMVYASLGYDVGVIEKLERLVSKVDSNVPSYLSRLDKGLASALLDVLYNVTYYVREVVLNNHLNFFNLEKIKKNYLITSNDIGSINVFLDELMYMRRNLTSQLHKYIVLAESKTDKSEMQAALRKIVEQNGEIKKSIVKMMFVAKSIENLVNVQE